MTFHKIMEGVEAGDREAWLAFLSGYTPVFMALGAVYLPGADHRNGWREFLAVLAAGGCERLRRLDQQAEREFLVDLRYGWLERGAPSLDASRDSSGATPPSGATVAALIKDLPLAHQEIVFLKLAGYSNGRLEKIFNITPAVAQKGLERLRADYGAWLEESLDRCRWPAAWLGLVRDLRAARTESCPPLRQFVRVIDGQVSWGDKEPVENHLTGCLACLERWTALREVIHWRREAKPLSSAEAQAWLSAVPVRAGKKLEKSFFQRMFG